jgi:hypothetical protein
MALAADDALVRKVAELEGRLSRLEAQAAADTARQTRDEITELRRELSVLAEEVEKLRLGEAEREMPEPKLRSLAVATSAGAIYRRKQGVSIAGYGEMIYENPASRTQSGSPVDRVGRFDFLRAVVYTGYRFNERFVFNSEVEFEHAGREVALEFAYLDYIAGPHLTVRGGKLLVPMGLTNEFHEPNAFLGVRRSETERRIIPSTWSENGFGALGSAGKLQYRVYLLNGLDAAGFSSDGLRGGRQDGAEARAADFALVGRLDLTPVPGFFFGGSVYRGGSGQGQFVDRGRELHVGTTIGELHAQLQARGFDVRGLYARASVGDAAELARLRGLSGKGAIGSTMHGGYLQLGYNLLSQIRESMRLTPYYRLEKLDTHARVPPGFAVDPARDRTLHTAGVEFRPIGGIVLKTDYQWLRDRARTGVNQFNLGLGYAF